LATPASIPHGFECLLLIDCTEIGGLAGSSGSL